MPSKPACAVVVVAALLFAAGTTSPLRAGNAAEVRTESFRLLNQGVSAYRRGDYAQAVERLQRATSMALNNFRAYFYLGLALIGDRRYPEAIEALDVALDLDPDHLQSHIASGDARLKMGDLDEARASYFRALKLRPEYAPALDGLARIYEAGGDEKEAVEHFRRAIASDAGYAPAYTHLGDFHLRKNQYEEAVQLLQEAVSVRPDFAAGLNRLALAYGRLGLDNQAVATIQQAMEFEPKEASHPATLGWLQLGQGFVARAEQWFLKALELDPAVPDGRMGLAEVARRRGGYELALGQLDTALADPRLEAADRSRLREFRDQVAVEQVEIAALEQHAAEGSASPEELGELAAIYARRGLWARAVELQQQAGDAPEQLERLAYMLFRDDRYREAFEIYSSLARQNRSAVHEVNSGVSVARLGDDEAALAAFRRALEIEPDNRMALVYAGNALLRLGRKQPAVEAYKTFLDLGWRGEAAERVRRILQQIAPEALPQPVEAGDQAAEPTVKPKRKGSRS